MKIILILVILLLSDFLIAQTTIVKRDFETWSSVGVQAGLGKRWDFEIEEQIRLWKNSTLTDEIFTDFTVKYTAIKKHLKFALGYRYIFENRLDDDFDKEQRFNADMIYYYGFDQLKLKSRLRYQNRNDVGEKISTGDYPIHTWRILLEAEYKIKNWKADPVFSVELFRKSQKYTLPGIDNIRFRLGTCYKMKKFGDISIFYQIDHELGVSYSKNTSVIGLSYKYNFGNILKK